ncbi:MAG: hypothetical protein ABW123_21440 [Cystobacter sp.]
MRQNDQEKKRGRPEPGSSQKKDGKPAKKHRDNSLIPDTYRYYFNLPGNMTGDIWHLAAAMCLTHHFASSEASIELYAAIGVVQTLHGTGKSEARSPELFRFLQSLGLPTMSVKVTSNLAAPWQMTNCIRDTVNDYIQKSQQAQSSNGEQLHQKVIDQKISTTILMHHVRQSGRKKVIEVLREKLPAGLSKDDQEAMDAKVRQIQEAVRENGGKHVVLLNRRVGDVNKQHDTTEGVEAQLKKLAAQKNMFVLGIATPEYKPGDIDLFDTQTLSKGTFVDKRRTAYFWMKVSQLPEVHGLIGGRSGSMDIAAFMGMRAFSWDENLPGDEQYLRLLQTHPIMSIGHVTKGSRNEQGSYEELVEKPVSDWLEKKRVCPKIPQLSSKVVAKLQGGPFVAYYLRTRDAMSLSEDLKPLSSALASMPSFRINKDGNPNQLTYEEGAGTSLHRLACLQQARNTCGQRAAYNAVAFLNHPNDPVKAAQAMADHDKLHQFGRMPVDVHDEAVRAFLDSHGGKDVCLVWSLEHVQLMMRDPTLLADDGDFALYGFLLQKRDTVQVVINTHAMVNLANKEKLSEAKSIGHYFAAQLRWTGQPSILSIAFADSLLNAEESRILLRHIQFTWGTV